MLSALQAIPPSTYPPSFENNPFTFGLALFSLTLISALSLAQVLHYLFETRAKRAANKIAANVAYAPTPRWSALEIHRLIVVGFLTTVLLGALPDVIVMLLWGEASLATMERLNTLDRIGDGLTILPFLGSTFLIAWAYQALPQALVRTAEVPLAHPTWHMLRDKIKIIATVLIISVGVTVGKAIA